MGPADLHGPAPNLSLIHVARGIAHAMLKPVAAAREQLEDVAARVGEPGLRTEVENAAELLAQLQRLVRDLLDLARAQGTLQSTAIPAGSVVRQAAAEVRRRLPAGRIALGKVEGTLLADEVAVRCLLVNLLENAIEAGSGEGSVSVNSTQRDDWIELVIEDRSGGIPAEVRERLFEPFVTTRTRGTGLGLAVVREVCLAHGGRAEAESTPLGTRFVVRLPAATG
jgi:signal transduction histidine kinase